jgi:6,7-dimethyl-8-ribityllumazine synthase
VPRERVDIAWVPGAFEIPLIASKMARADRYAAVLCLGAVIRGETTHDEHINRAVSISLAEIGVRTGIPVLFGLLTCNNLEQAIQRSGGSVGNKGSECAAAAIEMVNLLASMDSSRRQ